MDLDKVKLRIAVIGAGKFGSYHAAKYAALEDVDLIAIVDTSINVATTLANQHGCAAASSLEQIIDHIDAASIATPATTHAGLAVALLHAGKHIYIEKPLATSLKDAQRIIDASKKTGAIIQCGFQERYILSRLHLDSDVAPQRIECRRLSPWTRRGTDVDVAMDLMIHDIDMVLQLAGDNVTATSAHGAEDELSAVLQVAGCTAHLHASRRATQTERTMLLVYEDGTVYIDFLKGKIHDSRPITLKAKFGDLMRGANSVGFDPLGLAISDFVKCIRRGSKPSITAECGLRALSITLSLRNKSSEDAMPCVESAPTPAAIPLFDIKSSVDSQKVDLQARIARVLEQGRYIDGPEVSELEGKLAAFCGARFCMTVSSGTTALTIAIMGEGLSRQDAVFVPTLTYNATCNAVLTAGATPVFVDVDKYTCNISEQSLTQAIEAVLREGKLRPAIICAVDLYGKPAPYQDLTSIAAKHSMVVLADAAQSFGGSYAGTRVGNLADISATSFYPSKTLGGLGDGGALFTNDEARYRVWQSIRWHGTDKEKRESVRVGLNGRMSTMQCAMLLSKLKSFEEELRLREAVASHYTLRLSNKVLFQQREPDEQHANGLFTIILSSPRQRRAVIATLTDNAIASGIYYPLPLHQHRAFARYVLDGQRFSIAEWLAKRVLSLPMTPYLTETQVDRVCQVLNNALRQPMQPREVAARL